MVDISLHKKTTNETEGAVIQHLCSAAGVQSNRLTLYLSQCDVLESFDDIDIHGK